MEHSVKAIVGQFLNGVRRVCVLDRKSGNFVELDAIYETDVILVDVDTQPPIDLKDHVDLQLVGRNRMQGNVLLLTATNRLVVRNQLVDNAGITSARKIAEAENQKLTNLIIPPGTTRTRLETDLWDGLDLFLPRQKQRNHRSRTPKRQRRM